MSALTEVKSSAVKAFSYNTGEQVLTIETLAGKRYRYAKVPSDVAEQFAKAKSFGRAWGSLIRGKFDLVPPEPQEQQP